MKYLYDGSGNWNEIYNATSTDNEICEESRNPSIYDAKQ